MKMVFSRLYSFLRIPKVSIVVYGLLYFIYGCSGSISQFHKENRKHRMILPELQRGFKVFSKRHMHILKRDEAKKSWSYSGKNGVDEWSLMFHKCAGKSQSPIDIVSDTVFVNDTLPSLSFIDYDKELAGMTAVNNGHTVMLTAKSAAAAPFIEQGGLCCPHTFLQLHFHWGHDDNMGSEHTINGKQYPMEMHLVHIEENSNKQESERGLAVLSVLFDVRSEANKEFDAIIDILPELEYQGTQTIVQGIVQLRDLLPANTDLFYRYKGSLTTPPCSETVTWSIFKNRVIIGEDQIAEFRKLKENLETDKANMEFLSDNYRAVQPIYDRKIYSTSGCSKK